MGTYDGRQKDRLRAWLPEQPVRIQREGPNPSGRQELLENIFNDYL